MSANGGRVQHLSQCAGRRELHRHGASIYFDGSIAAEQDFLTQVAASSSGSKTYIDVFAGQAAFDAHQAPVQTDTYVTGGSQSMHLNDTIGSVKVAGYVGHNGGFLTKDDHTAGGDRSVMD